MDFDYYIERIVRAKNTAGELTVSGIKDARKLVNLYDYLDKTAMMLAAEKKEEAQRISASAQDASQNSKPNNLVLPLKDETSEQE